MLTFGKLLDLKYSTIEKTFALKNCLCWKIVFIEKTACIEKLLALKNYFTYKNVTFKIMLGTWYKINVWKFSFSSRNSFMTWLYNKGYLNQNFDIGNFHIYRMFV
jgi:hypothetical protein